MTKLQSVLFFLFAAIFTASTLVEPYPLSWLVKLPPMFLLIAVTVNQLQHVPDQVSPQGSLQVRKTIKLFLVGLVFSSFGDFFLDYDRVNWFIFGLGSFLVAHLFYIMSLAPVEKKRLSLVVLYSVYGLSMFWLISSGLKDLFIPVLVYMSVLLMMGITTLISTKSNSWLIIGGLCFVASDSLIGINRFYINIPYSHLAIMITYYFAQYALTNGIITHTKQAIPGIENEHES